MGLFAYVGTYAGGGGQGIYVYRVDASGALTLIQVAEGVESPSYLAFARDKRFLYAVDELDGFEGKPQGALAAFAIDASEGTLDFRGKRGTGGVAPCHVAIQSATHGEAYAWVANYGGSVAVLPMLGDGSLGELRGFDAPSGSGPNVERQAGPHPHCVAVSREDPAGSIFVVDLGADRVWAYAPLSKGLSAGLPVRADTGALPGGLMPVPAASLTLPAGSGPRHMCFHPSGRLAYVVHELAQSITVFASEKAGLPMVQVQTVSLLPDVSREASGWNYGAAINMHPSGRFLFASNRGHDSLARFAVDGTTGRLTPAGHIGARGHFPRSFGFSPDGSLLLVANQKSGAIAAFRLGVEAEVTSMGPWTEVPSPAFVGLLALP